MKQVDIRNKEELDKERYQVHYSINSPGKARRPTSFRRRSCPAAEAGFRSRHRPTHVGHAHDRGMANKENELTCSDEVRGNCGLPVNSAGTSKMAEADSKYSDFTELSKDHEALTHVLFGRNLRLKVAQTLWRRNASEFVAYLIRIQDTGVFLDCLPVLTNDLQTEAPGLTLGCCVDLIPQVKVILASKYEEHVMVGLHWVQTIIKKWWPELSNKEKRLRDSRSEERNIEVMKQRLKDLWKEGAHICLVPGSTGELAKAIQTSLSQLP